jgi:hypothetical protein
MSGRKSGSQQTLKTNAPNFSMSKLSRIKRNEKEETVEKSSEPEPDTQLAEEVQLLQAQVKSLERQVQTIRRSTIRIGLVFAVPGILSLAYSVLRQSQVLAFIGLGLTFWGALFFLVRPVMYVRGSLLNTASTPLYSTIDRILNDLRYGGRGLYVPPYPKRAYLPEHLMGLKETVVFISAGSDSSSLPVEEMATGKFMTQNPKGMLFIPPGLGLMEQLEKSSRTDFTKMSLEDLCASLPQLIMENFQLAKEIEMRTEKGQVYLKTTDSIYTALYRDETLKSLKLLGCPLASAVACAIAKTTGKTVSLQKTSTSPDARTVEVSYSMVEAQK